MWFNLTEDDEKLITALVDKNPVSVNDLLTADPLMIKLHALRTRITDFKTEQAELQSFRDAVQIDEGTDCDGDACVSYSDDGAYVMTWTWVSNEDAGIEDDEATERCDSCGDPLETAQIGLCDGCQGDEEAA